jgi:endonuclease III related protein
MADQAVGERLGEVYRRLLARYGHQYWWPAKSPFEVIVGAILTQSAAWTNVEKAIANLAEAGALSPEALRDLPLTRLAALIHPCGYYNAKAFKLKSFVIWLGNHYQDDLNRLFAVAAEKLRAELLSVHGIGEETADSITLYAAGKPVFVIDAYTRRIMGCLGLKPDRDNYAGYQAIFRENLAADAPFFNEYHALLVCLGKDACRKQPRCAGCCLNDICGTARDDIPEPDKP